MKIDHGWLDSAEKYPSPNCNARPEGAEINLLIIHNISLPEGDFDFSNIKNFFLNKYEMKKDLKVSSHIYIKRNGDIVQFVPFYARAWHAGVSEFHGQTDCNDFSIGIELAGTDYTPYTQSQYHSLHKLTKLLQKQYPNITNNRIVGHSDIAPQRKTDPGESFDWKHYLEALESC